MRQASQLEYRMRSDGLGSPGGARAAERGAALIIALMAMLLMTVLGITLMLMTSTETKIANNFRNASEALHAAEAGLERSIERLAAAPDWSLALSGALAPLVDGSPGARRLADGAPLDLIELVNMANCQQTTCGSSDYAAVTPDRPWGANNPRWQLFAHGPLADLLPTGTISSPFYVVVLVGDDQSENDMDPSIDGGSPQGGLAVNPGAGVIALRAEAFGPRSVRRVVEATVARTGSGVRLVSWREGR